MVTNSSFLILFFTMYIFLIKRYNILQYIFDLQSFFISTVLTCHHIVHPVNQSYQLGASPQGH
jgi:hypothetical protein